MWTNGPASPIDRSNDWSPPGRYRRQGTLRHMSADAKTDPRPSGNGEEIAGANGVTRGLSQPEIAFSIYKGDPFIRWPAHWMRISGPRVMVFFILLGFIDVVVFAPVLGSYDVGFRANWVGLSTTFLVRPVVWGIFGWMPFAIAGLFSELQSNGVVSAQDERYEALVRASCARMGGAWLTVVAVAFGVGSQVVGALFFASEGIPPWSDLAKGDLDLRFWLFAAPIGAATWYALVKVLVRAALFSIVISKIFHPSSAIPVTIQSVHPDGAGGLGSLGRYAVGMSLFAAAALLFLSTLALAGDTNPLLEDSGLRSIHFVLSMVLLYPLLVWLYLFAPIWLVHRAMLRKRNKDLLDVSKMMGDDVSEMKAASSAPDTLAPRIERLHQLEEAYALIRRTSPRWPFSRTTLGYLGTINLFAVTSTVLGLALTVKRLL